MDLRYETAHAPDAVVYHHLSATAGGPLASYYAGRNMLAVLVKDVPAPLLRRYCRAIFLAQIRFAVESVRHLCEPAARARIGGQFAVLRMLPTLLRQRRLVQASMRASADTLDRLLYAPEREYARIPMDAAQMGAQAGTQEGVTGDGSG